jgi:Restriction endonuclease S subunits
MINPSRPRIADLPLYPAKRDSGLPWLGNVPGHWDIGRAKWLFRKMDRPVRDTDEVVTCFRDGVVTLRKNRRVRGFTESLKEIGYQGIRRGDLVIHGMDAFAGAVGVSDSDGKGTPVYSVCEPAPNANAYYYSYVVREMARSEWILALAKGIRERSTDFRFDGFASQPVPLPPLEEQAAIVRYLDHADRRIRRYIAAKKKLIALLNEQKQAIIHRAVTRGLDPDVRLKPSGFEWLGDVPEHWEVRKLRQCGSIVGGMTPSMEVRRYWDGAIPWVTPKDMKRASIVDSSVRVTEAAIEETSLRLIDPPAVLMVVRGMILARRVPIAWTTAPVTINQDMKALEPVRGVNAEYLARSLDSAQEAFAPLIDEAGHGTRRLPTERWRDLAVAMPPADEQATVVGFLGEATRKIVAGIDRAECQIALLREFRTRLIADVVTGKLDVREAAAQLPDEEEAPEPLDDAEDVMGVDKSEAEADFDTAIEVGAA